MKRIAVSSVLLGLLSCGEPANSPSDEPEPVTDPGLLRGLIPLAQLEQPTDGPHLTELAFHDGYVYVGNSNDVFAIYRPVDDPPGLELVLDRAEGAGEVRCTTFTIHEPSASLYCADDDAGGVTRYDLGDPTAPARAEHWNPVPTLPGLAVRDIEIVDGRLWFARYDMGLSSTAIGEDGTLGELIEHPADQDRAANLRFVAGGTLMVGTQSREVLWTLGLDEHPDDTLSTRLSVHTLDTDPPEVLASIEIDGPPLALDVDGENAIVGLGSFGAELLRWQNGTLEHRARLDPTGVVTGVALEDDAAITTTMRGASLYDLRGETPRLAGWHRGGRWTQAENSGSMLHAALFEGELFVSDWNYVHRFGLDLDGEAYGLDLPRGLFVAFDGPVRIAMRSMATVAQRVEVTFLGEVLAEVELEPGASAIVDLPVGTFEVESPNTVSVRVYAGTNQVSRLGVIVLRRAPLDDAPSAEFGHPPPGAAMPEFVVATGSPSAAEPLGLPLAGRAFRLVFYGPDCAAMWPELDDLVWRARNGDLGERAAVLVSHQEIDDSGFAGRMLIENLDALRYGFSGEAVPPDIVALDPSGWVEVYDEAFNLAELPSAAYHPTDYEVDAEGTVITVEREYRGTHALPL